jgi:hypothetical protein
MEIYKLVMRAMNKTSSNDIVFLQLFLLSL